MYTRVEFSCSMCIYVLNKQATGHYMFAYKCCSIYVRFNVFVRSTNYELKQCIVQKQIVKCIECIERMYVCMFVYAMKNFNLFQVCVVS